jgi:hypothetical protein
MARYCGQCGSVLGVSSLLSGRCASCGAEFDPSEETYDVQAMVLADDQTQEVIRPDSPPVEVTTAELAGIVDGANGGDHAAGASERYIWSPRQSREQKTQAAFWTLALLSSGAVLVAAIGLFFLTQHGALTSALTPFTSSSPSAASGVPGTGGATATTGSGQRSGPTATTAGGGVATATSPASGTPAATPTSGPPPTTMSVSPTSFSIPACSGTIYRIVSFTVSNTGGATLYWKATVSVRGYSVTPSSGTLGSGLHVKVAVSGIQSSGTITISSVNATNSPLQVVVTCG